MKRWLIDAAIGLFLLVAIVFVAVFFRDEFNADWEGEHDA